MPDVPLTLHNARYTIRLRQQPTEYQLRVHDPTSTIQLDSDPHPWGELLVGSLKEAMRWAIDRLAEHGPPLHYYAVNIPRGEHSFRYTLTPEQPVQPGARSYTLRITCRRPGMNRQSFPALRVPVDIWRSEPC